MIQRGARKCRRRSCSAPQPEEIVFTSCGTESDSTAIRAAIESYPAKRHLVTSRVEHPAIKNLFETLAKKGYRTTFVPVDGEGRLDLDYLYDHLTRRHGHRQPHVGQQRDRGLFPVEEISRRVKERGIVFHTDAVQAVGKVPIDLSRHRGRHAVALRATRSTPPRGSARSTSARAPSSRPS